MRVQLDQAQAALDGLADVLAGLRSPGAAPAALPMDLAGARAYLDGLASTLSHARADDGGGGLWSWLRDGAAEEEGGGGGATGRLVEQTRARLPRHLSLVLHAQMDALLRRMAHVAVAAAPTKEQR